MTNKPTEVRKFRYGKCAPKVNPFHLFTRFMTIANKLSTLFPHSFIYT